MKKAASLLRSSLFLCGLLTVTATWATEESSRPIDDHPEWLACTSDTACTSVKLGCYYWQPVNRHFASAAAGMPGACGKSNPAGPQPTVSCVDHQCVNDAFAVPDWAHLEPFQKFQLVIGRVEACLQASGANSMSADQVSWGRRYEAVLDEQIRDHELPDNQLLTIAAAAVVPCAELLAWEQGQEKWRSIQAKDGSTRRVVVSKVQPAYSLDILYPPLMAYAETYQQCGQAYTRSGVTFWGDMHVVFTLDDQGRVDPDSLKASYPGIAYVRPFLDCASAAFKKLSFPHPQSNKAISIEALIQVQSNAH